MANGRNQAIRIHFWGMAGEFSYLALQTLVDRGLNPQAIIIPAAAAADYLPPITRLDPDPPISPLPLSQPYLQRTLLHLGWQHHIPVYQVRRLRAALVADQLTALAPDVALVACFPWRIPAPILAIPRCGFLNLHPSLLPELRGPYPLFWAFRLGLQQTGVTVHQMDPHFDTGPIALQQQVALPDGIIGPEADRLLAQAGAPLLVEAVHRLQAGSLPLSPQAGQGSTYGRPAAADFTLPTTWSARRAYNFIRGTAEWNHPYRVTGPAFEISVRQALSYDPHARQDQPLRRDGRDAWIQFSPGVLHAR